MLRGHGHRILIQKGAGDHAGFPDADYRKAGAILVDAKKAWGAELVVKVKEPLSSEYRYFRPKQILFTFLHLAPNTALVKALRKSRVTAVAYETVEEEKGKLPILEPMSEIAGRIAALMGAYYQANPQGGRGVLFGGMPGVPPAHVVILGGGTVGENAARVALGMGSRVTILERRAERMRYLDEILPHVETLMADPAAVRMAVAAADILIGAVHIAGARTPQLVTRAMVKNMKSRSVIIDVAIDQGGSSETSRPTSHDEPTYIAEGVLHYCVPNMPEDHGRTSTLALTNTTVPYIRALAQTPPSQWSRQAPGLSKGIQIYSGHVTCKAVAKRSVPSIIPRSTGTAALKRKSEGGFTLIELMIVVAIVSILSVLAFLNYTNATRQSEEAVTKGNLSALRAALGIYYTDNDGAYQTDNLASLTLNDRCLSAIPIAHVLPYHGESSVVTAEPAPSDTGGWSFNNVSTDPAWGSLRVGCRHQDSRGQTWTSY